MASLVFLEPGGVANYLERGAPRLSTTATLEGDEWVLSGEKVGSSMWSPAKSRFYEADSKHRSGLPIAPAGILKAQIFHASSVRPQAPALTSPRMLS